MSPGSLTVRRRDLAVMHARAIRARYAGDLPRPDRGPMRISLWLPTTALFLLLAPFALLLLPFLYLAPRQIIPQPAATLFGIGRMLLSLGGMEVDVDRPDVRVRLRLF